MSRLLTFPPTAILESWPTVLIATITPFFFASDSSAATLEVPGEYATIQAGIDAASAGDTVLVAVGIYSGAGNRDLDFGGVDLVLLSEADPGATIDCEGLGRGIYFHTGESGAAVVDGFTIKNGFTACCFPDGYGGGIFCGGGTAPTIRNCVFENNYAERDGGGVYCGASGASIANCRFYGNSAAYGGGVYCGDSSAIADCRFDGNEGLTGGGGITVAGSGSPVVERCVIRNNTAKSGGGVNIRNSASPTFDECLIVGNLATINGGGFLMKDASPNLASCTVSGNRTTGEGGGIYSENSTTTLERGVLWGDCAAAGDEVYISDATSVLTVECSDIDSSGVEVVGGGVVDYVQDNLYVDPVFCDPRPCNTAPTAEGDYRLQDVSPCLPAASPCGTLIGALGEGCVPSSVPGDGLGGARRSALRAVVPNPSRGAFSIRLELGEPETVRLRAYDVGGRRIETFREVSLPAGAHEVHWALNAAGVYLLRLEVGGRVETRRVVIAP